MKKKLFSEIPCLQGERLVLKQIGEEHADALWKMLHNPNVYKYLPTFLLEKKYEDIHYVIRHLYDECFPKSLILGIFDNDTFCGLAELYEYREQTHKVSIGCRLTEECWGKGITQETLRMLVRYLIKETDIEIITASTMVENRASANAAQKAGFKMAASAAEEDWGYPQPTLADKWIWLV